MPVLASSRPPPALDDPNAVGELFFELAPPMDFGLVRSRVQVLLDAGAEATGQRPSTVTVFPHAQRFLVVGKGKLLQWLAAQAGLRAQTPPSGSAMIKPVRKRPVRAKGAGRGR
ncbi:MAG: hypothetical protein IT382_13735 [Deltaproteobacteria bacterium]|nr:hypothetical protein [Deltaproteobacteria bacterium]